MSFGVLYLINGGWFPDTVISISDSNGKELVRVTVEEAYNLFANKAVLWFNGNNVYLDI